MVWRVAPAVLLVVSWGICAASYATEGVGSGVLRLVPYLVVAVLLTALAARLVAHAGYGKEEARAALPVSLLAVASVLFLALSVGLRG